MNTKVYFYKIKEYRRRSIQFIKLIIWYLNGSLVILFNLRFTNTDNENDKSEKKIEL